MPTVSIVLPTHNRGSFLVAAIRSVLAQDFSDFELIVVDDGSMDDTAEQVRSVADPRVRYLYQENAGRSAARNRGIAAATAPYLAFLDDDDVYLPRKVGVQVRYLDENPRIDLVGGGVKVINAHGREIGSWPDVAYPISVELEDALYSCPLMPSTVMLRRSSLGRLSEWFSPRFEPVEDKELFLRSLASGWQMVICPEPLSLYRVHGGNSQGDAVHSASQNLRCLEHVLSLPGLPSTLSARPSRLYGHYYLVGALHAFSVGQLDFARASLEQATALDADLLQGDPPRLVELIAGFAHTFHVSDPLQYIDLVVDQLPSSLVRLRRLRKATRSAYFWKRVFDARSGGRKPRPSDWVRGVLNDPRWLRNRGIWSIFVYDILPQLCPQSSPWMARRVVP